MTPPRKAVWEEVDRLSRRLLRLAEIRDYPDDHVLYRVSDALRCKLGLLWAGQYQISRLVRDLHQARDIFTTVAEARR